MAVALVVCAVAAVVAVVAALVLRRRLVRSSSVLVDAERRLVLADERAEKAEAEVRGADARRTTAEERAVDLETGLAVAERERSEAVRARDEALSVAEEARASSERTIEEAALRADAGGMWFLEALRIERRWRATVGLAEASVFGGDEEPALLALVAVTEMIREESGTSFDVEWRSGCRLAPGLAFTLVRAGDELLSALAVTSDGGVLVVDDDVHGMRLTVELDDEPLLAPELLAVFGVLGWEVSSDPAAPGSLVLTVPSTDALGASREEYPEVASRDGR